VVKGEFSKNIPVGVKLHWGDSPKFNDRVNEHKIDQCSEVCEYLSVNPTHHFKFKQPEILEASSVTRNFTHSGFIWYRNTSQISTSMVHLCPCGLSTFLYILVSVR